MRSSQALTLAPLLSCHWRYACVSFATLSEGDPIAVTSRVGRDDAGTRAKRVAAILPHPETRLLDRESHRVDLPLHIFGQDDFCSCGLAERRKREAPRSVRRSGDGRTEEGHGLAVGTDQPDVIDPLTIPADLEGQALSALRRDGHRQSTQRGLLA